MAEGTPWVDHRRNAYLYCHNRVRFKDTVLFVPFLGSAPRGHEFGSTSGSRPGRLVRNNCFTLEQFKV
jgi:hypothetical protein